jgi:dTDP-4-dehydrorhamnose reductase
MREVEKMTKVLILGANGMLGHACDQILSTSPGITVVKTARAISDGFLPFDAASDSISELIEETRPDWIVNCIGVIKPHIKEDQADSVHNAVKINAEFPFLLARSTTAPIIQIATDCVFSGNQGSYTETDLHDALDVYGKTKSLGEAPFENLIHLRASIIGPELGRSTSLLEWFRNQPVGAEVNGFTDHLWNGVTTHHFGMLTRGIISNDIRDISKVHIIPTGQIRKSDLLKEFSHAYDRGDITIREVMSNLKVDRTLSTVNPELNKQLWSLAGFDTPPTVAQMVQEQAGLVKNS